MSARRRPVAPCQFHPRTTGQATLRATLEIGQDKSQIPNDSTGARSHRARSHAASIAISIAAHAILIAAFVYFAPALSKPHSDWVLAYLVDVRDGSLGRSMHAGTAATLPTPIRSEAGPLLISASRRSPNHAAHAPSPISHAAGEYEAKVPDPEAASLASRTRAVSPPADSRGADSNSSNVDASTGAGGNSAIGSGSGSGSGLTDGVGDRDGTSIAHADYGSNPPPAYPGIARRREPQ